MADEIGRGQLLMLVQDCQNQLAPGSLLRSLDAIDLATAELIGADHRAVVTYEQRMRAAAPLSRPSTAQPGWPGRY